MKKFTKLFLTCAAVTAVTAAVATTAMAADVTGGQLTGTYADGQLTLTGLTDKAETVLVLKAGTDTKAVKDADILYVNQDEFSTIKLMGAPSEEDAAGAIVLVGYTDDNGQFAILQGKIGGGASALIGDVNLDEDISLADATAIVLHYTETKLITDEGAKLAADTNADEDITLADATCIVNYYVGNTDKAGHVGEIK